MSRSVIAKIEDVRYTLQFIAAGNALPLTSVTACWNALGDVLEILGKPAVPESPLTKYKPHPRRNMKW